MAVTKPSGGWEADSVKGSWVFSSWFRLDRLAGRLNQLQKRQSWLSQLVGEQTQPASGRVSQASMMRRVSWAMASSSLVGTTRIVTGESGVEIARGSLERTAFFSSSMTRPR